jgi:hypothetical protein
MSTSIDNLATLNAPLEHRFYPRVAPQAPETVPLRPDTGSGAQSILLNLSENGLLLSTACALDVNSVHRVSLNLRGIPKTISVYVRAVWTENSQGLAGVQLLDLSDDDRELLRRWSALQSPQHEVFALSESATESVSEVAANLAPADSASSQRISDDDANTATTVQSQMPSHSSASPLYFWGAALAIMCLGTAWASTHNVLGDFKAPKPSSIVSSVRPHRSPVSDAQPANPQSISNPASAVQAPVSNSTVSNSSASSEPLPKSKSPLAVNRVATSPNTPNIAREAASPNRAAFSRPIPSTMDAPNRSPNFRNGLPNESDSLRRSNRFEATSNPMPPAQATVPQPAPAANSHTEITGNALADKSAIVGSTGLSTLSAPPDATSVPSLTAKAVSSPPHSSSSLSAATISPVTIPRNTTHAAPTLEAGHTTPSPFIVDLPFSSSTSLVSLPGERVIDSPSLTMHIQRSVWLRGGLRFWRSRKKVEVGQLSAHVDPQTQRAPRYGSITVQAMIDEQGRITGIKPLYGSIAFLPAVSRALSAWRYQPTYVDNKPVETVARIEFNFHSSSARSYRP